MNVTRANSQHLARLCGGPAALHGLDATLQLEWYAERSHDLATPPIRVMILDARDQARTCLD